MSGKGSSPRLRSVDRQTFEENWDRAFGKGQPKKEKKSGYRMVLMDKEDEKVMRGP